MADIPERIRRAVFAGDVSLLSGDDRRFWSKVAASDSGCWLWTASKSKYGYGRFMIRETRQPEYAHRMSYESLVGPIPDGLVIDHLCCVPACVNPEHLEAVAQRINILRGNSMASRHYRASVCQRGASENRGEHEAR